MILLIGCTPAVAGALGASARPVRERVLVLASPPAVELARRPGSLDGCVLVAGLPAMTDERRLLELRIAACGFADARVACLAPGVAERPGMWGPASALARLTTCESAMDAEAPLPLHEDVDIGCLAFMDELLHGLKNATLGQALSARRRRPAGAEILAKSAARIELLDILSCHPGAGRLTTMFPALRQSVDDARSLADRHDWSTALARLAEAVDRIDAYWRHCSDRRARVDAIERGDGTRSANARRS